MVMKSSPGVKRLNSDNLAVLLIGESFLEPKAEPPPPTDRSDSFSGEGPKWWAVGAVPTSRASSTMGFAGRIRSAPLAGANRCAAPPSHDINYT
jgi:hypothetical protein